MTHESPTGLGSDERRARDAFAQIARPRWEQIGFWANKRAARAYSGTTVNDHSHNKREPTTVSFYQECKQTNENKEPYIVL